MLTRPTLPRGAKSLPRLREARRGAKQAALTQVVIDLLPATDGGGGGAGAPETSEALVGRLKTLVLTQVRPGVLTRALRAIGELSRLDADGHDGDAGRPADGSEEYGAHDDGATSHYTAHESGPQADQGFVDEDWDDIDEALESIRD